MGYLFIGNLTLKSDWILASNFSSQYHPSIKCKGHNNKGKDYQLKKLLIVEQIWWKLGLLCQTSYLVCDQISQSNFSNFQCIQEKKHHIFIFSSTLDCIFKWGWVFQVKQRGRIQDVIWPPCSTFQFVEWGTDLIHLTFHHRIIYWLIGNNLQSLENLNPSQRSKCVVNTGLLHLPSGHFKSTVCFKAAKLVDELYSIYFSLGQE